MVPCISSPQRLRRRVVGINFGAVDGSGYIAPWMYRWGYPPSTVAAIGLLILVDEMAGGVHEWEEDLWISMRFQRWIWETVSEMQHVLYICGCVYVLTNLNSDACLYLAPN